MTTHVGSEDRRFEHLAERSRLIAEMAEIASQEVVEVVSPEHVNERDSVEILQHGLVLVDLSHGRASVDLGVRERSEHQLPLSLSMNNRRLTI